MYANIDMADENERRSGCTALMQTPVAGEIRQPPKNKIMMGMARGAGKRVTRTATKRASKR